MAGTCTTRREFLRRSTLAAAAAAVARAGHGAAENADPKRNIILYVTDDLGRGDAGCYGNTAIRMPGLDRLAAEGTRFNRAYCSSPSCSASRSCILTGMHTHATGQYGLAHDYHHFHSFDGKFDSLPKRLGAQGYRTVCAGKYHVQPESAYPFDTFLPVQAPEAMAEACRPVLEDGSGNPFFLYFCTVEPHRPFRHEPEDRVDPAEVIVPPYLPDTPACREELALYYASARRADRGLERLLDLLDETGRARDTLVVFISDNGIAFPGAKTTVYEPGVNLPCVVRNPFAARRGLATEAMVSWADLAPALCEFAGAPFKQRDFHGRSFLSVLEEEQPEGWDTVFGSHTLHEVTMYYPMRWMRAGRWKLIWNIAHGLPFPFASDLHASAVWQDVLERGLDTYGPRSVDAYLHRPRFELYDLESDPLESNNLADAPEHAATLARLQGELRAFQERTRDPWILKWERE